MPRPGSGTCRESLPPSRELIVNPQGYELTGDSTLADGHSATDGDAILSEALVSGPRAQL
jgi:hypothetical protein